ncbi:class D sortase [Paenibacillus sp. MMS18-CY102]|uniref:class D sortase n=1 Tax=Paenibacillus sp. MMS18-CY102 TaxID=2682849 RepID=UPI00136571D2|nr:class D sortase [Paenibacillus sp. MMS18-CY102]MWC28821.1 sortase [Paenibacillus sp. MMS18-CY102]
MFIFPFKLQHRLIGWVLWFILFVGVGCIVYPRVDVWIQQHKQDELLTEWNQDIRVPPRIVTTQAASTANPTPVWSQIDGNRMLGSLQIAAIDLNEPIIYGASAESLKKGTGTVVEDRLPGREGNFVLAGHRSWKFGRHFNRLGELKLGDLIEIQTSAGTYRYKVSGSAIVSPDDLTVLDEVEGKAQLTLITCYPKRNPTHRLIIRADLQQQ